MLEHGQITKGLAVLLMFGAVVATAVLSFPNATTRLEQQDACLPVMVVVLLALLINRLVVRMGLFSPGKTWLNMQKIFLAKRWGKLLLCVRSGYFFCV